GAEDLRVALPEGGGEVRPRERPALLLGHAPPRLEMQLRRVHQCAVHVPDRAVHPRLHHPALPGPALSDERTLFLLSRGAAPGYTMSCPPETPGTRARRRRRAPVGENG